MKINSRVWAIVRGLLSVLLLGTMVWLLRAEIATVSRYLVSANPVWFLAAWLLNQAIMVLLSVRMQQVFSLSGISVSLWHALRLTYIGYFFNNFLPTSAGGDIVKAYYSSRLSGRAVEAASAVLIDRVFGTYGLFLLASVAALLSNLLERQPVLTVAIYATTVIVTVGLLLLPQFVQVLTRISRTSGTIQSILRRLHPIAKKSSLLSPLALRATANSIATKFMSSVVVILVTKSLGIDVPFVSVILVTQVAFAASLLPSLNGLGFREGAIVFFMGPISGNAAALAIAALWLGVYLLTDIMGGLIYGFSSDFRATGKLQ